jgi:pimeloyl-ACP methyl ester carboxylesterase
MSTRNFIRLKKDTMKQMISVVIFIFLLYQSDSQVPYGTNATAGKYVTVRGTRIYYETYGEGKPLLLLHGSILGYIDEFSAFIPELSKHFKVIAPALRGHGKSELGEEAFSYKLFAEDAMAVLKQEGADSVFVLGFSAGAITGYYLAANYPNNIIKLVSLAGVLNSEAYRPAALSYLKNLTVASLEKMYPDFIAARKKIMVQPERYQEMITRLSKTWVAGSYTAPAKPGDIKCPVLTIGGDRDFYFSVEAFVSVYQQIPGSQLAIIPNADHVTMIQRKMILIDLILPFLLNDH